MPASVAVIFCILAAALWLYRTVQAEEWAIEREAAATVITSTYMYEVTRQTFYSGDQIYRILYGVDKAGEAMIAWLDEQNQVHAEYRSEGVHEQYIKDEVLRENGEAEILRVSPAKINDEYAWEVLYRLVTERGEQYFYNYYRFRDGMHLEGYRMAPVR